jgi:hypothetical protein
MNELGRKPSVVEINKNARAGYGSWLVGWLHYMPISEN